jgi:hypothetical protein
MCVAVLLGALVAPRLAAATRCVESDWIEVSDLIVLVEISDSSRLAPIESPSLDSGLIRWRYRVLEVLMGRPVSNGSVFTEGGRAKRDEIMPLQREFKVGRQYVLFLTTGSAIVGICDHVVEIQPRERRSEEILHELRERIRNRRRLSEPLPSNR